MVKKILIATGIFPPDIGGPATYSKLLLEELPKRDFDVQVVTYGEAQSNDPFNLKRISRRQPKGIRHCIYFWHVGRLGKKSDIIFAQDPVSSGLPAMLASYFRKKKFVIKIVGDYAWEQGVQRFGVRELPDEFQGRRYGARIAILRWIQRRVARMADKVIVPSEYLKRMVVGWGVTPERISVIPNAVTPIQSLGSREQARKELNICGNILVSVGRLVPWKGFDTLIRVVSDIIQEFPDLKLYIVGDGPEMKNLQQLAHNLHLKGAIIFTGALPKDQLISYLRASDLFVLNTGYEGLSHQIREALSIGLPVITTDVGGNPEIINNEVNGLLVSYNNHKELKQAISKVLTDKGLQQRLGETARKKEMVYTHNLMLTSLKDALKNL
jgi:glycosyltransferase involved in cell wall biosynthesis